MFGALETSLLSLPYDIVGTINVIELPQTFTVNGSVSTSTLTSTLAVPSTSFIIGPPGASQSIVPVTLNGANPTWSTLGTVLTYPTTYVQYLAFQGAAVTSPETACAQTLAPASLTLPASTEAASYIYPQDSSINAIPIELLDFLDADGTIPDQLDGNQLTTCAALGAAPVAASTAPPNITVSSISASTTISSEILTTSTIVSTSFSTSTTISTSTSTISTVTETLTSEAESSTTAEPSSSVLEVTLTSSTLVPATTESTIIVATQTVTKTPALVINTITGPVLIIPTTPIIAASAAAESMTTESSSPSDLISNLFSIIDSLSTTTSTAKLGPYVNSTTSALGIPITTSVSPSGAGAGNATTTSYTVPFDGAASHVSGQSMFGGISGLLAALLML